MKTLRHIFMYSYFNIIATILLCVVFQNCSEMPSSAMETPYSGPEIDSINNEYINSTVIYNLPSTLNAREVNTVEVLMITENYLNIIFDSTRTKYSLCNHFGYDTLDCEVKSFTLTSLNKNKKATLKQPNRYNPILDPTEIDTNIVIIDTLNDTIIDTKDSIKIDSTFIIPDSRIDTTSINGSETTDDSTTIIIDNTNPIDNEPIDDINNVVDAVQISLNGDFELSDLNIKRITPISENLQVLSDVKESKWIWKVYPKKKGALNLQVVVDANRQYNDGRREITHNLDTYEKSVFVNSTLKKEILYFFKEKWWWFLIGILSLFYFFRRRKIYINKNTSSKDDDNSEDTPRNQNYLTDATNLIKGGKIQEALNMLIDNVPKDKKELHKMLLLFSSKYAIIKRDTHKGIIDDEEKNQNSSLLINGIIEVISELENETK